MTPTWRIRRAVAGACVVLALTGCRRVGVPAPATPPSLAACPAPDVRPSDGWRIVRDSAEVTYRLPAGFVERQGPDLPYREWRSEGDLPGSVRIGFSPSREHFTTLRRVPSPGMREMSECVETVQGREVLVQAWRTEGGSFRGGRRYDLYEIFALVSVEPTRTLFVTGGGADRRFQGVLLTIARTVEVREP